MTKNHMKRLSAPQTWKTERKTRPFITRPNPGSHSYDLCVSINTFLKEYTDHADTTKEVIYLLRNTEVHINQARVYDKKRQIGFLDVLHVPEHETTYLVSINPNGTLKPILLDEHPDEYFDKITTKKTVKGGKSQYGTLLGRTIILDTPEHPTKATIRLTKTGNIKNVYPLQKESPAFIFKGKHAGKKGKIHTIKDDEVILENDDENIQTKKEYIITTGNKRPSIDL